MFPKFGHTLSHHRIKNGHSICGAPQIFCLPDDLILERLEFGMVAQEAITGCNGLTYHLESILVFGHRKILLDP